MKKILTIFVLLSIISSNATFAINQKGNKNMKKVTQTAGRDQLKDFAPEFAHFK